MNELLKEAARHYAARDYKAAETVCRTIIDHDARHVDALHLLGVLLTNQDRPDEAITWLRRAAIERPDHPQIRLNLGNALLAAKQYDAALAVCDSRDFATLNNLGLAHRGLGQHEAAARAFRQATQTRRDFAPAWFNLATTLAKLGRPEDALQAATTARRCAPLDTPVSRLADVSNEIGRILLALGRPEEALSECRRFLAQHPAQQSVTWNMSLCLLLLGQFTEGWRAYEHRFLPEHDPRPQGAVVLDPDQVSGQRILILTEQGRGDMLQFIRYAPLLADRGATVLVQAYPELVDLLAATPGIEAVVSTSDAWPPADLVTPVMSLPLAFGQHPNDVPYLRVPADRRADWLGARTRPRIGLAWSGSPHSYERSAMPVEALAPLLALPGFEFHCLQKHLMESDQGWLDSARPPISLHTQRLADFADTAALIDRMDIVVAIDTAVAHLSGALAKPTGVMLPFNPDWRWMLGRSDSPWYPTARLFRQPVPGDWASVIRAVIAALPSG